ARHPRAREGAAEPGAHVQGGDLRKRGATHGATSAGGPVESPVVDHHRVAIARQLDVELDHVGADLLRATERRQRVLGRRPARPPMSDHLRCHRCCVGGALYAVTPSVGPTAPPTPRARLTPRGPASMLRAAWRCTTASGAWCESSWRNTWSTRSRASS